MFNIECLHTILTNLQKLSFDSDFYVSCASCITTLLTIDNGPFLPTQFCIHFANVAASCVPLNKKIVVSTV